MGRPKPKSDGAEFFKPRGSKSGPEESGGEGEGGPSDGSSGLSRGEQALLTSMESLHKKTDRIEAKVTNLEERFEALNVRLSGTESNISKLEEEQESQRSKIAVISSRVQEIHNLEQMHIRGYRAMESRLESVENSVRASNLRILGIPAQSEGDDTVSFMGTFLTSILGLEEGKDPPLVIKAHRLPSRRKEWAENGAGTMLVTLADIAERDRLMDLARRKRQLSYEGQNILIFPDLGQASQSKRIVMLAFRRELANKNIVASVLYPAKLRVTLTDKTYMFADVEGAKLFMEKWRDDSHQSET